MPRLYLTDLVWSDDEGAVVTALHDHWKDWRLLIETADDSRAAGAKAVVLARGVTDAAHQLAVADSRIVALPLEKIAGQLADDNDTIADIPAAARLAVRNRLEALGIDLSDVAGSWTILRFLAAVRDRIYAKRQAARAAGKS